MKRILIAILTALTLLAGWTPAAHAADRTPLLMEGKKTLYQRVITHPGASLYAGQGEGSTVIQNAVRPFSVFYVYTRYGNWLEVGASTTKPDGWIKATDTTAWNQALTLLFTDRSQRQPVRRRAGCRFAQPLLPDAHPESGHAVRGDQAP